MQTNNLQAIWTDDYYHPLLHNDNTYYRLLQDSEIVNRPLTQDDDKAGVGASMSISIAGHPNTCIHPHVFYTTLQGTVTTDQLPIDWNIIGLEKGSKLVVNSPVGGAEEDYPFIFGNYTVAHDFRKIQLLKWSYPVSPASYVRDRVKIIPSDNTTDGDKEYGVLYTLHPYSSKIEMQPIDLPPFRICGGAIGLLPTQ